MNFISRYPFIIFLIVSLPLTFLLAPDYGISYDETFHKNYGNFIIEYYMSFGKNPVAVSYIDLFYYGGFYDVISQIFTNSILYLFNSDSIYEVRHFFNGWIGLLGFYFVYKICEISFSKRVGLLAYIFLLGIPEYTGHIFFNPKDIPFSSFYIGAVYFFIRYTKLKSPKLTDFLLFSVFTGFAIGVRILGILLWPIFGLFLLSFHYRKDSNLKDNLKILLSKGLQFFVISYTTALLFWPYLLKSPVLNAIRTFKTMSQFPWAGPVMFAGEKIKAPEIGRKYLPTFFAYTLPDYLFLVCIIGLGILAYLIVFKKEFFKNLKIDQGFWILVFAGLGALFIIILKKPVLYNGYRQVFFVLPPIICILAKVFSDLIGQLDKKIRVLSLILIAIAMADSFYIMYRMHPYEYIYFNRTFSSGMEEGWKKFDSDYWATSIKEGSLWLKNHLKNDPRQVRVSNSATASQSDYYFNKQEFYKSELEYRQFASSRTKANLFTDESMERIGHFDLMKHSGKQKFLFAKRGAPSDYLLATRVLDFYKEYPGDIIHTVERMGIPILYVMKRR
ncbi:glycosyltransferase family 39 protein [Leptospira ilyithenensis]|nr:glycosyltransferase family 39 protein [Leptospira ilyithenensis]